MCKVSRSEGARLDPSYGALRRDHSRSLWISTSDEMADCPTRARDPLVYVNSNMGHGTKNELLGFHCVYFLDDIVLVVSFDRWRVYYSGPSPSYPGSKIRFSCNTNGSLSSSSLSSPQAPPFILESVVPCLRPAFGDCVDSSLTLLPNFLSKSFSLVRPLPLASIGSSQECPGHVAAAAACH